MQIERRSARFHPNVSLVYRLYAWIRWYPIDGLRVSLSAGEETSLVFRRSNGRVLSERIVYYNTPRENCQAFFSRGDSLSVFLLLHSLHGEGAELGGGADQRRSLLLAHAHGEDAGQTGSVDDAGQGNGDSLKTGKSG